MSQNNSMIKHRIIGRRSVSAALMSAFIIGGGCMVLAQDPVWVLPNGKTMTSRAVMFEGDELLVIASNPPGKATIPFAALSGEKRDLAFALDNAPYPQRSPPWPTGYRARYPLRVAGDLTVLTSRTVMARIPTGGWMKTNAADIVVQTVSGQRMPVTVMAHDPAGNTIIQFKRNGYDRWYWASIMNPNPEPLLSSAHRQKIEMAEAAARSAQLEKMALQKTSAEKAEIFRKLTETLAQNQATHSNVEKEVSQWDTLIPQREAALSTARGNVVTAEKSVEALKADAITAKKLADEKVELLKKPTQESAAAHAYTDDAMAKARNASNEWISARNVLAGAVAANKAAAEQQATLKQRAFRDAEFSMIEARRKMAEKDAVLKQVEEAVLPIRLASARAATLQAEAEKKLGECQAVVRQSESGLVQGRSARAAAEQLRSATAASIIKFSSQLPSAQEAATAAKNAADQAVGSAHKAMETYARLVADTDPTILREGLTVEFRDWIGDELIDWPIVYAGLNKSDTILGNAIATEVLQNANPMRANDPRNFAASYRGFLKVTTPGIYRFFVNSDDAAYLFINGYKVFSRRGSNRPISGRVSPFSIGEDIELEQGVHPFEIHHVVGNSPGAQGQCQFLWLTPGSKAWSIVPQGAFPQSLLAVPATVEESGGGQAAVFTYGIDDTLSSDGITLYLVRFEATGTIRQPDRLTWDFGDGTRAKGRSVTHIYFRDGDYTVGLTSQEKLPVFRRRVNVCTAPVGTSPYSLSKAVDIISAADFSQYDLPRLSAMFGFLMICEQPTRWPVLERLSRYLLNRRGLDIDYRVHLYSTLMEAVAQQGRASECQALLPRALAEVPRLKGLQVAVQLTMADIQWKYLKDFREASRLYEKIITENRRLRHPPLRRAAIAWGDMFMEMGDQARAGEAYRLATSMGEGEAAGEKAGDATTRGALLRVAEQQLKSGNTRQSRRLLDRIENDFPEQKLEGLYRYLRAETDRTSGHHTEAIRNYELLLQLRQWSGFRAQALYGIADSYSRSLEYGKCLETLKSLKESFPDYYEQNALGAYEERIVQRLNAQEGWGGVTAMTNAGFKGCVLDFEPGSRVSPDKTLARLAPSLGIDGGYTWFMDALPKDSLDFALSHTVRNLVTDGMVWVEFWYRTTMVSALSAQAVNATVYFGYRGSDSNRDAFAVYIGMESTYGEWRKIAVKVTVPATPMLQVALRGGPLMGLYEIDGFRVLPISDQQNEALRAYIEGANPQ